MGEWFSREWPMIKSDAAAAGHLVYDFEQASGEMVYVPPGWWHAVVNLESSVAVTHNVLHRQTLRAVIASASAVSAETAVKEAFQLVDSDEEPGAIRRWLDSLRGIFSSSRTDSG